MNATTLSIITPIFCNPNSPHIIERARLFISNSLIPSSVERIIVDFGSPSHITDELARLCASRGMEFHQLRRYGQPFSAGVCRNYGAQLARGEFITFQDIDLIAGSDVYAAIIARLRNFKFFNELEIVPCLYLTERGTNLYLSTPCAERDKLFFNLYQSGSREHIHMFAPVTSSILLKREFFLSTGGNREDFFGHGYEDFESLNRLANLACKFVRSSDYYSSKYSYDSIEYKGYRPFFSMFGRSLMAQEIFFVHLWHPTGSDKGYEGRNAINREKFVNYLKDFDKSGDLPQALGVLRKTHEEPITLILGFKSGKTVSSIRQVIPFLGPLAFEQESEFPNTEIFADYLSNRNVNRVFFFNPYGNNQRLSLYNYCRKAGIRYIAFDRGALPNSWFFDGEGFNADSNSYTVDKWAKTLSNEQTINTENYIFNLLSGEETLESNGSRVGYHEIVKRYRLQGKRVIFCPFQRPEDTVIKYFSGAVSGVEDFAKQLDDLAAKLGTSWAVLAKKHPLEKEHPSTENICWVEDDVHFYDLISAADAVLLVNSGVGLYSLLYGKPTFCVGESFYVNNGLAIKLKSVSEFEVYSKNLLAPDVNSVLQFTHYLVNEFYSFGKTKYEKVDDGHGLRNVALRTDFDVINIAGVVYKTPIRNQPFARSSPVFSYFRYTNPGVPADSTKTDVKSWPRTDSKLKRKTRKLFKHPIIFFRDAFRK